ncbi:tetratricopeptide repeat protein [Vibrio breoganii]
MSVVNNALSKLAEKEKPQGQAITKAEIPEIKRSKPIVWLVGGFAISMAIGGWAVSQQQTSVTNLESSNEILTVTQAQQQASQAETVVEAPKVSLPSPTHSKVQESVVIHTTQTVQPSVASFEEQPEVKPASKRVAVTTKPTSTTKTVQSVVTTTPVPVPVKTLPVKVAKVAPVPTPVVAPSSVVQDEPVLIAKVDTPAQESMTVEQVELTPRELANKSIARAEKALDSNDVKTAFTEYSRALRLVPSDENVRQKLAALYYGRKDARRAATLLQDGIRLNDKSEELRFALAKLLIKEQQPEAALSPLMYVPENASEDYLALRAGVAQQLKNTGVALESYQSLAERDPNNARWWLGLAIQQERRLEYPEAHASYTKALGLVGVSRKTQSFIRDRLQLLESLEGDSNGD